MKREITFCSAPFFRVSQDVFQKGGKSSAGDGFLSFLFRKRKKDGTNAYEARRTRKERRKDGNENRKNREADGRKRRKKRKRGDASPAQKEETHLLLSFSLLQNLRKGNMLPAQKEKNVSLLFFLFLFCLCSLNSAALTSSFASLQTTGAITLLPIRLYMHSTWTGRTKRKRQFLS